MVESLVAAFQMLFWKKLNPKGTLSMFASIISKPDATLTLRLGSITDRTAVTLLTS